VRESVCVSGRSGAEDYSCPSSGAEDYSCPSIEAGLGFRVWFSRGLCAYVCAYTCTCVCVHACVQYVYVSIHAYIHTRIHTYACTHTHKHTCTHACMYVCTCTGTKDTRHHISKRQELSGGVFTERLRQAPKRPQTLIARPG
jgi:hypothetical protein